MPLPLRVLLPDDAVETPSSECLGRQLQLLIAAGDLEFVRGIAWQVNARVEWLLEATAPDKAAGFILLILSPFLAL